MRVVPAAVLALVARVAAGTCPGEWVSGVLDTVTTAIGGQPWESSSPAP